MSDVCGNCKQPFVTGRVVRALDRRWHKDCFKCIECKLPILDPTFTEIDHQPLCAKCAESKGGIRENGPCGICGAKLGVETVDHPLTRKSVHAACLRCYVCQKVLENQVVTKDNQLCHPGCAVQSLAQPCVVCKKALNGTTFTIEGRSYHQTCFADWSNQAQKMQALVRGRLERKGVALERALSKTSITDSSITPARARRLSGVNGPPPFAAPKTNMLPSVPEDGSFTKPVSHSPKTTPPPPPSSVPPQAVTAPGPRSPSPASRSVAPPPPPATPSTSTTAASSNTPPPTTTATATAAPTGSSPVASATSSQNLASPKPAPPPPQTPQQQQTSSATATTETKGEFVANGDSSSSSASSQDGKQDAKSDAADLDAIRQKEAEAKAKRQKTKDENWGTEAQIEEEEVYEEPPLPTTIQGLRYELAHCASLLSSVDGDWGLRVRALHRIEALVSFVSLPMPESTEADPQSWTEQIDLFRPHFAVQVNELRSSIVRETCRLLIALSKILGNGMSGCIGSLLPNIISNSYVTVKVIRESSITCTSELVTRVPSVSYLPPLLILLNDAHAPARASATKHIGDVLKGDEVVCSAEHKDLLEQVLSIIPKVFEDKDPEVRKNAIFLFTEYKKRFPEKADALFPTLSARAQKAVGGGASTGREAASGAKRAPFRPPFKAKPADEKGAEA